MAVGVPDIALRRRRAVRILFKNSEYFLGWENSASMAAILKSYGIIFFLLVLLKLILASFFKKKSGKVKYSTYKLKKVLLDFSFIFLWRIIFNVPKFKVWMKNRTLEMRIKIKLLNECDKMAVPTVQLR